MQESTFEVTGMTCSHCVAAVTEEVSTLDGVTAVHIELATGQVRVTSRQPLVETAVADAVDEAGYALVPGSLC